MGDKPQTSERLTGRHARTMLGVISFPSREFPLDFGGLTVRGASTL
jgi:hypothetical protein